MKTIIILLTVVVITTTLELPSNITLCHKSDPKVLKCLGEATETMMKIVANGLKGLDIKPIDPLRVEKPITGMSQWLKLESRNVVLYGSANLKVLDFQVDWDKLIFKIKCTIPRAKLVSDYTLEGRILVLPIQGKGKSNILIDDGIGYVKISLEKYEKNGEIFAKTTNVTYKVHSEKVLFHFDNFFNGNTYLGKQINEVLNKNSKLLFEEFKPPFELAMKEVVQDVTNKLFNFIPFNQLILE